MGRKTAVTAEQVIEAIKGTGGIEVKIAAKLGVARQTVATYINRWATVREAYEQEKRVIDDAAVSVVITDIVKHKNVSTAKWWIERKLDDFNPKTKLVIDWRISVIAALKDGTLPPEAAAELYPDLAGQLFRAAGVGVDVTD